jgi:nicotinamidase/pyrazinamidase
MRTNSDLRSMDYDRRTALLVVDVQNDFADPEGSISVPGAAEILPVVNRELLRARVAGALIVYTGDWHPETTPHFRKDGGLWPVHCVRGTWGARLHPAVCRIRGATMILKGQSGEDGYSGFFCRDPVSGRIRKTALHAVLRRRAIHHVVVVGLATDHCVKHTALDAIRAGFRTTVLPDAVRAVELRAGDGARALEEIVRCGGELFPSSTDQRTHAV